MSRRLKHWGWGYEDAEFRVSRHPDFWPYAKSVLDIESDDFIKILEDAKLVFRNAGADLMQLATGEDYVKKLQEFFIRRA